MFKHYINNLSLRFKLILFLIIPVITILYFAGTSILLKFDQQQEGQKSIEFILISFQIDDVIHELQKERGISAGFIGSKGSQFHNELLAQRKLTDNKIQAFSKHLAAQVKKNNDPSLSRIISHLKLNRKKLAVLRADVDKTTQHNIFERYSNIIASGISNIRHFQVLTSDAVLARQSDAYSNLLLLQERSGQERALLNGIFTDGKIDATQFKLFAGYISEQEALFKEFYTIATKDQQAMLAEKMQDPRIADILVLQSAVIHKASRNDRLNSLLNLIGYGGLIHDFKNYVISGEQKYLKNIQSNYKEALEIINDYQALPEISTQEMSALNIIKQTFDKYNSQLQRIQQLKKSGHDISQIDLAVKVNDEPALEAINYLRNIITGQDTSIWWQQASLRINLMREVSTKIKDDILDYVQQNLSAATQSLYLNLFLTIASLLASFFLAYRFIRYLVSNIINIETHMSQMREKGEFDKLLMVKGHDEIGKLANEFNNLIKERIKFEEQLLLAAAVFEKSSEGMIVTDSDNRFLMVNPAFTHITGYSLDEITGNTPAILRSGKQDKSFYKNMWERLNNKGSWSGEILNRRKNGDINPEWLNINVITNNNGETLHYIAMYTDITERKAHEEKQAFLQRQLLQSQKMESLGQLTGGIAHDFNNMLSSILGYTELAMELGDDKEDLGKYLNEVFLAGNRAKELIARMLAFSRGGKDIEVRETDLVDLLNESVEMIRPLLPSTIEFETHFINAEKLILVNPVMIHQVIMNICINARDAIGEHGKIIFSSKPVSINEELCSSCHQNITGEFIEMTIQDTGSGITSENMNNLFEPFFSTKEMGSEKGTGMGLAMVHGIVHEHSGHIVVESQLDKGSTFRLLFPYNIVVEQPPALSPGDNEQVLLADDEIVNTVKGKNILIIDDEEAILKMLRSVLDSYDCQVTIFQDSELALQHFKENTGRYDLIITDQTMPKLTGAEFSKEALAMRADLPIIMCTGHSDKINKQDAEKIGIKAYMTKPIKNKDLLSMMARLIRN